MIAEVADAAEGDWWIIGSAAVVLHGASVPQVCARLAELQI
jgi:hypothetical protein